MAHLTEAEAIEADIRSTQSRIDSTVDAIKLQLSPSQLIDQGVNFLKAHGGDIGRNAGRKVAENPLPLALMASALAWLMIADGRSRAPAAPADGEQNGNVAAEFSAHREVMSFHERVSKAGADLKQGANESWDSFMGRMHDVRGAVMGVARNAGEDLSTFRDRVSMAFADLTSRAADARDALSSHMTALKDNTASAANAAKRIAADASGRIGSKAQDLFKEQPLVVGALGVALGALAGVLIPKIKGEDALLGEAGQSLRETASHLAVVAKNRVEDAAEHMSHAVADAARDEGLTVSSAKETVSGIVDKAERFAEHTIEAAREEVNHALRQQQ